MKAMEFDRKGSLEFSHPDEIRTVQDELLQTHVQYLASHSPYYRTLFKERGIKFQLIDLADKGMSLGELRSVAQRVGGTEAMIKHVGTYKQPTEFLVATEANMMWELQRKYPQHTYLGVPGITCSCNKCPYMAMNTLEKVRDCMKYGKPEITWQRVVYTMKDKTLDRKAL